MILQKLFILSLVSVMAFTGCEQPKPIKTIENLKAGIKGETTASAKYAAFSQKAMEEGSASIALLFESSSKSESIHASNHRTFLEKMGEKMEDFKPEFEVKSRAENLQAAIDGESYEVATMYPQFMADANTEKVENAVKSFTWAFDTEKKHQQFYTLALQDLVANAENTLPVGYAVCPVCGNTYNLADVNSKCAFCQTPKEKFINFNLKSAV